MLNIVFFGNPGVGKSTLLNTLTASAQFPSGLSFGIGLTKQVTSMQLAHPTYGTVTLFDSPGLDDDALRQSAASGLSEVLSRGGDFKLIFLTTIESTSTARSSDIVTMQNVLDALAAANVAVDNSYAVWINKCTRSQLIALSDSSSRSRILRYFKNGAQEPAVVHTIPYYAGAEGESNFQLKSEKEQLWATIDSIPTLRIHESTKIEVQTLDFRTRVDELQDQIDSANHHGPPSPIRPKAVKVVRYVFSLFGLATATFLILKSVSLIEGLGTFFSKRLLRAIKGNVERD